MPVNIWRLFLLKWGVTHTYNKYAPWCEMLSESKPGQGMYCKKDIVTHWDRDRTVEGADGCRSFPCPPLPSSLFCLQKSWFPGSQDPCGRRKGWNHSSALPSMLFWWQKCQYNSQPVCSVTPGINFSGVRKHVLGRRQIWERSAVLAPMDCWIWCIPWVWLF